MEIISSKDNEKIKSLKKLKELKYRKEEKAYLIEGIKIVLEAIEEKQKIDTIIICDELLENNKSNMRKEELENALNNNDVKVLKVTPNVFKEISDVVNPQGIAAKVIKQEAKEIETDYYLALDDIQDPGNLGTIIRTADSANIKNIILSKNSADPYSSKVLRSTMGAIFRINIIEVENLKDYLVQKQKENFKVVVTSLDTNDTIYDIDYKNKIVVIGNEANGVEKDIIDIADNKVIIPMTGKTESLNASIAAGIIIYEKVRQERL
jgi:TrmH family RNA methyltransferase